MNDEVLVKVENVSKKFCRSLKRSLRYGMQDMLSELNPFSHRSNGTLDSRDSASDRLRPDEFWAVKDVSFELRRGECLGLIGRNGAGKTTLLKMLNGLIKPDQGCITMRGRVSALISLGAGFNPILTGRENIYVNGSILGLTKKEIKEKIEEIIDFAEVRDFIDAPLHSYSSGMQVRLGFAIAAHCQPQVFLLDEVLAVGDMGFQVKCFNTLGRFREQGTAFILVSHSMHHITRFCSKVLYLSYGKTAFLGPTDQAVEQFHAEMVRSQVGHPQLGEEASVGSSKVRIERAYFLDENGDECIEVSAGQPVSVCVDYRTKELVENLVMEIAIRDNDGLLYQATNALFGVRIGPLGSTGKLKVRFDSLLANNQRLLISIALWDEKFLELFDWKRGLPLIVFGHPLSTGRCLLKADWIHEPAKTHFSD